MQLLLHFLHYWPSMERSRKICWFGWGLIAALLCWSNLSLGRVKVAFVDILIYANLKAILLWLPVELLALMLALVHVGQLKEIELPEDFIDFDLDE